MILSSDISSARVRVGCAAAVALVLMMAGPATGAPRKERVYGDSFGNLVIVSPSGYKRIVVGMGYLAAELEDRQGPEIVRRGAHRRLGHCWQPPVLWKGRSYMYGLADGEMPTPPVICD